MNETARYFEEKYGKKELVAPMRKERAPILQAGFPATNMIYLKHGVAVVSTPDQDGGSTLLYLAEPGSFLGFEAYPLTPYTPITDHRNLVAALTECHYLKIPRTELLDLKVTRPDLMLPIAEQGTARAMLLEQLKGMDRFSVERRLARRMLEFAQIIGHPTKQGVEISGGISQQDWADATGSSRESVNKGMLRFRSRGMIVDQRYNGRKTTLILDPEKLGQVSQGDLIIV